MTSINRSNPKFNDSNQNKRTMNRDCINYEKYRKNTSFHDDDLILTKLTILYE